MKVFELSGASVCAAERLGLGSCVDSARSRVVLDGSGRSFPLCVAHVAAAQREEDALAVVAADLEARIATVYERVACPKCGAPRGRRCTRVGGRSLEPLKAPHRERWTLETPAR